MPNYHSQHGEDVLLDKLFEGQDYGFFVEVGCIDGVRYSNTLTLEERGWRGLCIEAHAGYIAALRANRPGSIVEHCAAGESDEDEVTFYANFRGSLSTLEKSREAQFKAAHGKYFGGFTEQTVAKRRLNTLLRRHGIQSIDLLSLDIEGYELQALRGLDLAVYRPRVIVMEFDSKAQMAALDALVLPYGYYKWISLGPNLFYLADRSMAASIHGQLIHAELNRQLDEVQGTPAHRIQVAIDTRVADGAPARFQWNGAAMRREGWLKRLVRRAIG